jgi:hypothetical protein
MESKEIECNSGLKKYSLQDKIAIMTRMGINYLMSDRPIEEQNRNTKNLIGKILGDTELLEMLDKTSDEFWDEAKNGLLMYEDCIYMPEEKNLSARRQYCENEKFMTLGGEEIVVEKGKHLPALVKQTKHRVDGDRYFGYGI